MLAARPWLRWPYYGLLELQIVLARLMVRPFARRAEGHPVLSHLGPFVDFVSARIRQQGRDLGITPEEPVGAMKRLGTMAWGVALFLRSQVSTSRSTLEKTYLTELGFVG